MERYSYAEYHLLYCSGHYKHLSVFSDFGGECHNLDRNHNSPSYLLWPDLLYYELPGVYEPSGMCNYIPLV